ncbi:MAG: acetyl-CoA carboxylase biotin carboxyl carrier protein [Acidaminobacter sp.]|uniref:acetyl-CoA carboxylase biotin carboxyl carrier protein n=1 Tax=Acidaminobacter sp. TaxID=1872102 RepID=UPI0013828113|nr:acetyl-CoA carboxylase biotin carboxyl carrier protein [Acidaminobacter sp.]MZQ97067.1 acetyl-CoA carboxylase biotin carboxyl carrier protein [Acidaminobacter sp.]
MEIREIEILLQAFNATDLTRMAYSKDGISLVLERQSEQLVAVERPINLHPQLTPQAAAVNESLPVAAVTPAAAFTAPAPAPAAAPASSPADLIKAPLVGVFYAAPAPDAAPFVTIGQVVKKGQTLCIVEAMKVMNEIQAEWDGVVEQILAKPEDIVEYGQPLFSIRRNG